MAQISSYATLKTAVADYLARSDLTNYVPYFIEAAEERIYGEVRVRQMETALSDTIASGVIAVPSGFLALKTAYVNTAPVVSLEHMDLDAMYKRFPVRSSTGAPVAIARNGANFEFGPYPDSTYTIAGTYYKKLAALSDSNTTNWLITDAPYMLLFCALAESEAFNKDDARIPVWEAKYQALKGNLVGGDRNDLQALSIRAA